MLRNERKEHSLMLRLTEQLLNVASLEETFNIHMIVLQCSSNTGVTVKILSGDGQWWWNFAKHWTTARFITFLPPLNSRDSNDVFTICSVFLYLHVLWRFASHFYISMCSDFLQHISIFAHAVIFCNTFLYLHLFLLFAAPLCACAETFCNARVLKLMKLFS